jgi:hypothetical protein
MAPNNAIVPTGGAPVPGLNQGSSALGMPIFTPEPIALRTGKAAALDLPLAAGTSNVAQPSGGNRGGGIFSPTNAYIAAQTISALSGIGEGFSTLFASNREADLIEADAKLRAKEANLEALRKSRDVRTFQTSQGRQFLASGVTLEGTPIEVMEETRVRGQEEVDALIARAEAEQNLSRRRASSTRGAGRAAFVSGFLNAAGTAANTYYRSRSGIPTNFSNIFGA